MTRGRSLGTCCGGGGTVGPLGRGGCACGAACATIGAIGMPIGIGCIGPPIGIGCIGGAACMLKFVSPLGAIGSGGGGAGSSG